MQHEDSQEEGLKQAALEEAHIIHTNNWLQSKKEKRLKKGECQSIMYKLNKRRTNWLQESKVHWLILNMRWLFCRMKTQKITWKYTWTYKIISYLFKWIKWANIECLLTINLMASLNFQCNLQKVVYILIYGMIIISFGSLSSKFIYSMSFSLENLLCILEGYCSFDFYIFTNSNLICFYLSFIL